MKFLFLILTGLFMISTLVVLLIGVVSMGQQSEFYKKNANLLMRLRLILQGVALLCFAIYLYL